MGLKITDDNYRHYKEVFTTLWRSQANLMKLEYNSEHDPIFILSNWEQKSMSLAKRGLQEGLRDGLTMSLDLPATSKKDLNSELERKGLPNLAQLTIQIKDTQLKVLKRGRIKNHDEYYIIKEFLDNTTSDISTTDRDKLEKIFWNFDSNNGVK